jgi:hypothetical protein
MASNRYNTQRYNQSHYNLDGTGIYKAVTDTLTNTDSLIKSVTKPLADSVTSSDSLVKNSTKPLVEPITLSDTLTKQITQKLLSERIHTNDWVSSRETPPNPDFGA